MAAQEQTPGHRDTAVRRRRPRSEGNVLRKRPFIVSTLDQLQVIPPDTDLLVFDDMNFGERGLGLTAEEMIALLDCKVSKNIKCRHYDGCVPLLPRIFTTNLDCSSKQHPFSAGVSQSQDAEEAAGGVRAPSGALLLELW